MNFTGARFSFSTIGGDESGMRPTGRQTGPGRAMNVRRRAAALWPLTATAMLAGCDNASLAGKAHVHADNFVPWICTLLCLLFSAQVARRFLESRPRLYTVMALFALVWALLLPYYATPERPDALDAYAGFLLTYIGALLVLESQAKQSGGDEHVHPLQMWALIALGLIALPTQELFLGWFASAPQAELGIATVLNIMGYVSLGYGVWRFNGTNIGSVLAAFILCAYGVTEAGFALAYWSHPSAQMSSFFQNAFSTEKCALTAVVGFLIAYRGMPDSHRERGPAHWLARLLT